MVVEIRTLRVSADMDAAKYVAGAQAKESADRGMAASGREAAAAQAQLDQKITVAGNAVERLSRQYVDGYASAQRMNSAILSLGRALDTGKVSATTAGAVLDGIYRKYGMIADASTLAAKGQLQLAAAVDQANSRFAAQNRPPPVNPSIQPPANQNNAPVDRSAQFRRQNLGYQIFDVGQTAALGMNPAMILMQQGPQILQLYAGQGGVTAAIKDFASIVAGAARTVLPFAAAGVAAYGAYKLLASYSVEAGLAVSETTKALAAQASPIGTLKGQIEELKAVQEQYAQAIIGTADYSTTATNTIIANTEREFNAKKALLELEQKRQQAAIEVARAEIQIEGLRLKRDVAGQVLTRPDLVAGGYADPRIGSVPFVRLPDDVTGLDKTRAVIEDSPIADKLKEMRANLELTELAAKKLDEALKQTFDQAPYLINSDGRRTAVPVPTEKPIQLGIAPDKTETKTTDAYRDLLKSANDRIEQMKLETQTVALTGIAAQKLTFELDLLQKAQDKGRTATEDQRKEIAKLADEFERVATAAAKAKLNADLDRDFAQLGMTSSQQKIASRLSGAGLPVDFASPEANRIQLLEQRTQTREAINGFFTDFGNTLRQNGGDLGDALGKAITNAALNAAQKAWDKFADMLATVATNALLGTSGTTPAVQKVGGSILGAVTGSVPQAANSNVASSALSAANSNTDIASYIAKAAAQRGIDPATALAVAKSEGGLNSWNLQSGVMKNGIQEPSFGPFQLYKGGGLGNDFMDKTGLDPALAQNGPAGVDFALDHASKNGWGAWYGAKNTGISDWQGIGANTNMAGASDAVAKLADSASTATEGLNSLGGGLGQLGQSLSTSYFPAAPTGGASSGGGGLFGWLGGLFGGGGGGSQWNLAKSGAITGLFADGTESAPGGLAVVGERGREIVNLPRGSQVVPNHRTESMFAANRNDGQQDGSRKPSVLNVNINGASGDPHVRELVQQGVSEALARQAEADRRGGFGSMQARFTSQKG